ncbi:PREDICTED: uncharacterized protein LOC109474452 [Branchiostoma belcheri]|uniref:Uncharacterized protein LOC109474452 n=1 Tax=Branchiostoma belcheri TaxID=7741 RepID=A0A6P4YLG7_BRABE|nr:PREDICTED: uncharacterized protein LOC109474452 [Branchiostoma belcheri]
MSRGKLVVGNVSLTTSDLQKLSPGEWLNDKVITACLEMLSKLHPGEVFPLPSQLVLMWERQRSPGWLFEKICFASYKYLLLPICHHSHWMLLVANVQERTVGILNSSSLFDKYTGQFIPKWQEYMRRRSLEVEPQLALWQPVHMTSNRQADGSSCGVFVLMNAESLACNRDLDSMGQDDVPAFLLGVKKQLADNSDAVDARCARLEHCSAPEACSWLQCDNCHQWLHFECAGLTKKPRGSFICLQCGKRIQLSHCDSHINNVKTPLEVDVLHARRQNLEKRIVEYIQTQQEAEDHLAGIYEGIIPSRRHSYFFSKFSAVRNTLEGQGIGYITNEELSEELFGWLTALHQRYANREVPDTKYVACVLMPEVSASYVVFIHYPDRLTTNDAQSTRTSTQIV